MAEMDISKLTAMAGMPSSMSEALKQSIDFQRHLSDAMKPAFGFDHKFEELSKLANSSALLASQFGAASQFAKEMEEQSRHLKTLTEPLSLFRGSMLFSDQVTKAMASSLERHNAARELAVSFSTAASALRMSDEISKQDERRLRSLYPFLYGALVLKREIPNLLFHREIQQKQFRKMAENYEQLSRGFHGLEGDAALYDKINHFGGELLEVLNEVYEETKKEITTEKRKFAFDVIDYIREVLTI